MKNQLSIAGFVNSKSFMITLVILLALTVYFVFFTTSNVVYLHLIKSKKDITTEDCKSKLGDTIFVAQNTKDGYGWDLISESNFILKDTSYIFHDNNHQYRFTIAKAVVVEKK